MPIILANSEGWTVKGGKLNQLRDPRTSVPKNNTPANRATMATYQNIKAGVFKRRDSKFKNRAPSITSTPKTKNNIWRPTMPLGAAGVMLITTIPTIAKKMAPPAVSQSIFSIISRII